ncbi:hypothetical protein G5I_00386 [Acromyrmex echinatior]|uniref:Uncharacterized protein n=1 Tax=Acromyrmex echinatior TaxID=103372 RepID=F4W4R2_ACREC|nr:hypothetical protein G5I_00386 [Acromyrmex echinatior]
MMIHDSQGIIHKDTIVREWSIGSSLKQTLEVTATRRCVCGRRSERRRAGAASSTLKGLPGTSHQIPDHYPSICRSCFERSTVVNCPRSVAVKKARTCVEFLAQEDDAESLVGPRKTLLVHSELIDTCIGEQHIPVSVKRSSHRYRRLRRAIEQCKHNAGMFHLLRGVCIGIFFSTLNITGQPI